MTDTECERSDEIEVEDVQKEHIDFVYTITSYGADYPVDALVQRLKSGDIFIPEFQRAFVWDYKEACRFIESLLLGLPVPGIFVAKESGTDKLLVIDGHQRLRTLEYFYDEVFKGGRRFELEEVNEEFLGETYSTLEDQYRRRLNDSIIHLTIVRQDEPSDDNSSIYQIFDRLNSGGRKLEPQEIRACIYHGPFNELLTELNKNEKWRLLFAKNKNNHLHLKDQELILRFFALYFDSDKYEKPINKFLNKFMGSNKELIKYSKEQLGDLFNSMIEFIYDTLDVDAFVLSRGINAALFDSISIGVAKRLNRGNIENLDLFKEKYKSLILNASFREACGSNTSDEKAVKTRIDTAVEAFNGVP
jgi:uncharacterized protein with ParB-like and HNH nuclease domain